MSFVKRHIAAANLEDDRTLMERVVDLGSGEGLLFSPGGMVKESNKGMAKLGLRYIKIKIRERVTEDGGKSVLAIRTK
jgi:hypothetical protein